MIDKPDRIRVPADRGPLLSQKGTVNPTGLQR